MSEETKLPSATKHGGAGAYKRIQKGEPFVGLARIAQGEVEGRLVDAGVEGELMRDAIRLQVVSDLYYDAFTKAMQDQDFPQATAYLKVWGWIHNSSIRAWEATRKAKKADNSGEAYKTLIDLYRVKKEDDAPDN
jgi:hypothetical protein